jgi:hypothetical protein
MSEKKGTRIFSAVFQAALRDLHVAAEKMHVPFFPSEKRP